MAISGTITLGTGTTSNITSFDLYPCTSSSNSSCSGTSFATVSRATLLTGFTADNIPDGTFYIKINANSGECKDVNPAIVELVGVPTVSQTPTKTPTQTPTQTPTSTPPNTNIDPSYYYYAMGDCTDMKYSGYTTSALIPGVQFPVCMNYQEIADFYATNNWAVTTLTIDDNAPCGFGTGYTAPRIARSSTNYANETVFSVDGNCWSIIQADTLNVTGWTINLDSYTPYGGSNPCYDCTNANFTGFTYYQYTAEKCSDGTAVYTYSIVPYVEEGSIFNYENGDVLYLANHDINGNITDQFCATITGYVGAYTGPTWSDGTNNWPVGPLTCGGPYVDGCDNIECTTGRTDCFDINTGGSGTSGSSGTSGTSGGGGVNYATNVASITFETTNTQSPGGECPNAPATYYNSSYFDVTFTFKDSGGNPVVPNGVVEYRTGDGLNNSYGSFATFNYNGSSTYSSTYQYEDIGTCGGGLTSYKDSIQFRINNTSILLTYMAGD